MPLHDCLSTAYDGMVLKLEPWDLAMLTSSMQGQSLRHALLLLIRFVH